MQELFAEANITAQEISTCGIVEGPGSFTGIRIGLSFVKGLFVDGATKCYGLSAFEVVAHASTVAKGTIGVGFDARQDMVFWASFNADNGVLTPVDTPQSLSKEQFYHKALPSVSTCLFDTMGFSNSTVFSAISSSITPPNSALSIQETDLSRGYSSALLAFAQFQDALPGVEAVALEPNYMQASYAERARKSQ